MQCGCGGRARLKAHSLLYGRPLRRRETLGPDSALVLCGDEAMLNDFLRSPAPCSEAMEFAQVSWSEGLQPRMSLLLLKYFLHTSVSAGHDL